VQRHPVSRSDRVHEDDRGIIERFDLCVVDILDGILRALYAPGGDSPEHAARRLETAMAYSPIMNGHTADQLYGETL